MTAHRPNKAAERRRLKILRQLWQGDEFTVTRRRVFR